MLSVAFFSSMTSMLCGDGPLFWMLNLIEPALIVVLSVAMAKSFSMILIALSGAGAGSLPRRHRRPTRQQRERQSQMLRLARHRRGERRRPGQCGSQSDHKGDETAHTALRCRAPHFARSSIMSAGLRCPTASALMPLARGTPLSYVSWHHCARQCNCHSSARISAARCASDIPASARSMDGIVLKKRKPAFS